MSATQPETPAPSRILLVEDDPMIRALTAEWIEDAGFAVREVGNAADALGCLRDEERFRAAVLDVTLPDMTGPELAAELRRHLRGLPVLYATGNPNLLDEAALGTAATRTLRKPYSAADLCSALHELMAETAAAA